MTPASYKRRKRLDALLQVILIVPSGRELLLQADSSTIITVYSVIGCCQLLSWVYWLFSAPSGPSPVARPIYSAALLLYVFAFLCAGFNSWTTEIYKILIIAPGILALFYAALTLCEAFARRPTD